MMMIKMICNDSKVYMMQLKSCDVIASEQKLIVCIQSRQSIKTKSCFHAFLFRNFDQLRKSSI